MEPALLTKVLFVCLELHVKGIPFKINLRPGDGGKRSSEKQAELYAQGRTTPGRIVTYAKPGQSKHERGRAGHVEVAEKYRVQLGEAVERQGLVWGGRWVVKFPPLGDWQHMELS